MNQFYWLFEKRPSKNDEDKYRMAYKSHTP